MTNVKALEAWQSSQGTSEPITPVPKNMYISYMYPSKDDYPVSLEGSISRHWKKNLNKY